MAKKTHANPTPHDSSLPGSVYAERIESKFLVPEHRAGKLERHVLGELSQEKFPDNKEGIIWSVYFDNERLLCYRDQIYGRQGRFKIRFRRYGDCPNGFWEIKERWAETVYKSRLPVSMRLALEYGMREGDSEEEEAPVPGKILDRIKRFHLFPVLMVRQQRNAYQDERSKLRITFDRFLRVRPVLPKSEIKEVRLLQDHVVIVEMKRAAKEAENSFLDAMRREFNLEELGFSKYCRATEVLCGARAGFANWASALCNGVVGHDAGHVWKAVDN